MHQKHIGYIPLCLEVQTNFAVSQQFTRCGISSTALRSCCTKATLMAHITHYKCLTKLFFFNLLIFCIKRYNSNIDQ